MFFEVTPSALAEIRKIHSENKIEFVLRRICGQMYSGEHDDPDVANLLLKDIIKSCVYEMVKPKYLTTKLQESGLDKEVSEIITKVWSEEAGSLVEKARAKSVTLSSANPAVDISVDVNCQIDCQGGGRKPSTSCIMALGAKHVELDREHLIDLFDTLETVQKQLDALK